MNKQSEIMVERQGKLYSQLYSGSREKEKEKGRGISNTRTHTQRKMEI